MRSALKKALSELNIKQDKYDNRLFSDLTKSSGRLKEISGLSPVCETPYNALIQDVWAGFFKASPEMIPETDVSLPHLSNRPVLQKFLEDGNTKQLRLTTMLDELISGLATVDFIEKFNEELKNRPEMQNITQKVRQAVDQQNNGDEAGAMDTMQEVQNLMQGAAKEIRRAVAAAAKAAKEKTDEVSCVMSSWGLEPGDLKTVPFEDRFKLIEQLVNNNKFKHISDLVGRLRNLSRAKKKEKVRNNGDELHSITIGSDLSHILPQELVMLKNPKLKLCFFKKYIEHELMQYDLKKKEPKGRGHIVCCIDVSGSMDSRNLDHRRIDWAIAIAIALIDMAARQRRRIKLIFFNIAVVNEVEFLPGEKNVQKLIGIAGIGASGGTNYAPPLLKARETIETAVYKDADILFITDGECVLDKHFEDDFNEFKKQTNSSCYAVIINQDKKFDQKNLQWVDKVWISGQIDNDIAGEVFELLW